jgi:tetratricopeptide (TPR) repeat protein
VLTLFVYAPVRQYGFINFDDAQYVSRNGPVAAGLTWEGVRWAFTTGHAGNWHPLTWISHMLDVRWFGLDAWAHHVTNVALHLANSLLLLWLLYRMTAAVWKSAVVAALFAVHPLHVESVAWIAERKDVLCGFWWMLTLLAYVWYVRTPRWWRYALVLLAFALALMSKPMAVTLPFVLILLDVWPLRRASLQACLSLSGRPEGLPYIVEKLPLFALALASSIVTFVVQRQAGAVKAFDALPLLNRIENAVVAYGKYVMATVWPAGLAPLYPYRPFLPVFEIAASLVVLTVITFVAVRQYRARPYLLAGWLIFLGVLVPVIGLVQVGGQPFADRYTYLPSIGLFVMAVWGLSDAFSRMPQRTAVLIGLASVSVLSYALLARVQVGQWRDSITLWQHTLAVTSDNYRAHSNLGQALFTARRSDEAIAEFRSALAIKPNFAEAANYLGLALAERGQIAAAIEQYRAALAALPAFPEAHNNLGLALAAQRRFDEAAAEFTEAARLDPQLAAARSNLGIALAALGRYDDAVHAFTEALALQPGAPQARLNLAAAQRDRGANLVQADRLDNALADFRAAVAVIPNDPALRYFTAVALAKKGLTADAISEARAALRIDPSYEDAKRLLAELIRR